MAVSWGFTMLLIVTIVALFTFSQPLFQLAIPEETVSWRPAAVVSQETRSPFQSRIVSSSYPNERVMIVKRASNGQSHGRSQQWTRKLIQGRPRMKSLAMNDENRVTKPRRSVLASFQSDRMVPTGPNPLHNNNRSQVIFP